MTTLFSEASDVDRWFPSNHVEREAVLAQLDFIVGSSHFRTSKRYPSFLRFVVEQELAGNGGELKERTIGIEVFGRAVTYDTNEDPIVRVTAAEVRKRLASYYAEPAHSSQLRIHLSSGSYIPNFQKPSEVRAEPESMNGAIGVTPPIDSAPDESGRLKNPKDTDLRYRVLWFWLIGGVLLACLGLALMARHSYLDRRSSATLSTEALNAFWNPVIDGHSTVLTSIGTLSLLHAASSPSEPTPNMGLLEAIHYYNILPLSDATTLSRVSALLGERHIDIKVMNSEITSFDDVQEDPTIFIGAFTNQWTVRLTSKLRFYLDESPTLSRISDRNAKIQPDWVLHRDSAYSDFTQDYAIVARYHDLTTGSMTIICAGIGPNGTLAAGEFVTHEEYLAQLLSRVPRKDWERANIEAVIGTQVINGKSGPPRIVAVEVW